MRFILEFEKKRIEVKNLNLKVIGNVKYWLIKRSVQITMGLSSDVMNEKDFELSCFGYNFIRELRGLKILKLRFRLSTEYELHNKTYRDLILEFKTSE